MQVFVKELLPPAKPRRTPRSQPAKAPLNPYEKNQLFRTYARFLLDKVPGAVVSKPNIVRQITGAETNYEGGDAGDRSFSLLGP